MNEFTISIKLFSKERRRKGGGRERENMEVKERREGKRRKENIAVWLSERTWGSDVHCLRCALPGPFLDMDLE